MTSNTGDYLDGNAAMGALSELFAVDLTAAEGECAFCGAQKHFADAQLYVDAPGFVARCSSCGHILLRLVRSANRVFFEMRGLVYLAIRDVGLPKAIAAYFDAEKTKDVEQQTACFAEHALVHDEHCDYRGLDAIRYWKRTAQEKFEYRCQPLGASTDGDSVTVVVRLTGNFPGSPVELDHKFTLIGDKIASLVIE
jgi:hypothetical protein